MENGTRSPLGFGPLILWENAIWGVRYNRRWDLDETIDYSEDGSTRSDSPGYLPAVKLRENVKINLVFDGSRL